MKEVEKNAIKKTVVYYSIFASSLLILISIFRWKLIETLTVFLEPILELVIGIFF